MRNYPGTAIRTLRVDDELWAAFTAALPEGSDRSETLRAFMRWYTRERGARLPERPAAPPKATDTQDGSQAP